MKAKKLPSGSWNVQVFVGLDNDGKKIRKSFTAPTKKEAEYLAASFKAHHQEVTRDSTAMTLSEAIDKYIEFKGGTLSPSTVRGYRCIQHNSFKSIINMKINKITTLKVQAAINDEIGKNKAKTIHNKVGLLKSVLKMYAPSISLNGLTLPQREKFDAQQLKLSEVKTLMNSILEDDCAIPLSLALCCGLRASEIRGLTFKDYDAKNLSISINSAVVLDENNKPCRKGTKTTNSTRVIHIPNFVAKRINERINENVNINAPIVEESLSCIRRHLERICKNNNIPHVRLHDLRHINASVMLFLNIPTKYALERGGWDDIKTMDKIYQYTFADEKEIVDNKINSFFENSIKNSI